MDMSVRIDVRVDENLKKRIENIANETNKSFPDCVRELLEIGVYVKEKQLNPEEDNKENWEEFYQNAAVMTHENRLMLETVLKILYKDNKPLFESSSEEIEFIKTRVQQIKSRVVDGDIND